MNLASFGFKVQKCDQTHVVGHEWLNRRLHQAARNPRVSRIATVSKYVHHRLRNDRRVGSNCRLQARDRTLGPWVDNVASQITVHDISLFTATACFSDEGTAN